MGNTNGTLTAIDLFCGAGGLTLGLKKAGFKVMAGVESHPDIARTYRINHPDVRLFEMDIRDIKGKDILDEIRVSEVDLVAGCPPCQGFSKLTDKYDRNDPRNDLVFEMVRLIGELRPKMVMMENVPGLQTRGKHILDEFIITLESMEYKVNKEALQLADYGVPQSRKRLVLLAGKGFEIPLPKRTHASKSESGKIKPWLTVADIIKEMREPVTLSQANKWGGPQKFKWHVVRDLEKISLDRLRALKAGEGRKALPTELRPKCHKSSYSGFRNVYGRLSWGQTPPTMTGGCTAPCKGRFGHPDQLRTISVREAAMIQTFPKYYKFDTDYIETACDMIGNALPPKFAQIAAKTCARAYKRYEEAITRGATKI